MNHNKPDQEFSKWGPGTMSSFGTYIYEARTVAIIKDNLGFMSQHEEVKHYFIPGKGKRISFV